MSDTPDFFFITQSLFRVYIPWRIDGGDSMIFNYLTAAFLFVIPGNFVFVCGSVICSWKMVLVMGQV
jgi:hypothetical protein